MSEALFVLAIGILVFVFVGEPDIHDVMLKKLQQWEVRCDSSH